MKDLFQHLSGHFQHNHQEISDETLQGLLRVLEDVRKDDMPCSEVFARLDEYVDKEVDGLDAAHIMPLLREHLDLCPDCCEEYEALLAMLEKSTKK